MRNIHIDNDTPCDQCGDGEDSNGIELPDGRAVCSSCVSNAQLIGGKFNDQVKRQNNELTEV